MNQIRSWLIWAALALAIAVPVVLAGTSPLLAWREPVYIAAGFAGVIGLVLLLLQPLLAGGYVPGLPTPRGRYVHRAVGALLVIAVLVHVGGLWITSPPDVVDALLFVSPTPFSAWGVITMWAIFAAALMAVLRKRFRGRLRIWRLGHTSLAILIVVGTVIHALLIEGTMETVSKVLLCAFALVATAKIVVDARAWVLLRNPR